jgi:hypothetical protein
MNSEKIVGQSELVFNLWAVFDGGGQLIYALSGKAYFLSGSDENKLNILAELAKTDYVTATRQRLPQRFKIVTASGETVSGGADLSVFANPDARLFEELFHLIVDELPPIVRFTETGQTEIRHDVPEDPLCASTILHEDEFGNLRPIITKEDREWLHTQLSGGWPL